MQCGDEGQATPLRGAHLPGEQCADGVRDGVVHMQEIEIVVGCHFRHARRKRQGVGRKLKQRIVGYGDFVIENIALPAAQAKGLRVGDEVHLMTARGEFNAKFCGDDATAAVGGIAGDADLHGRFPCRKFLKQAG